MLVKMHSRHLSWNALPLLVPMEYRRGAACLCCRSPLVLPVCCHHFANRWCMNCSIRMLWLHDLMRLQQCVRQACLQRKNIAGASLAAVLTTASTAVISLWVVLLLLAHKSHVTYASSYQSACVLGCWECEASVKHVFVEVRVHGLRVLHTPQDYCLSCTCFACTK